MCFNFFSGFDYSKGVFPMNLFTIEKDVNLLLYRNVLSFIVKWLNFSFIQKRGD